MVLITDAETTRSDPIVLSADEKLADAPGLRVRHYERFTKPQEGIGLQENHAVRLPAGASVSYRNEGITDAVIVREAV